jgi:hypothetical protein
VTENIGGINTFLHATPIQTIPPGRGVKIEHTYEEYQVQGSWKIVSGEEVRKGRGDMLDHVLCVKLAKF